MAKRLKRIRRESPVVVLFTADQRAELVNAADEENLTLSTFVQTRVVAHLNRRKQAQARSAPHEETQGVMA